MTWGLWDSMSVDDRFVYNRPALLAKESREQIEQWAGEWLGEAYMHVPHLMNPLRPYIPSPAPKWYLLKYPDGTVLGFDTEEKAEHAAIGQDVVLIVAQEVGE